MLTLEETRWSLEAFKIFSIFNILPITVDVENGKIEKQSSKVKVFIWKILFGIGVAHWLYMFGRLVQSTILEPEKYFRWDHFVLHFGMTSLYAVFYFTGFRLFIKTPEENVIIFNQIFLQREDSVQKMVDWKLQLQLKSGNGNQNGKREYTRAKSGTRLAIAKAKKPPKEIEIDGIENQSESKVLVRPRPLLTWPPQYSLDELLAKLFPLCEVFSEVFTILILAVDPTRPQLLYSILPPEYQNVSSFLVLLAVEAICMATIFFTGSFAVVTQVLFFGKCQLEFQRMSFQLRNLQEKFQNGSLENGIGFGCREIEREIRTLRRISKEMQELVVFIELFNRCFPFCIFAWKICSLSLCITFYFFVVRHFEDFPFLTAFIGYCVIIVTLIYTIMYARAFSIPGKMSKLKGEFLLTAQKTTSTTNSNSNGSKILRAAMKREIKRIRGVGIKVGNFHQMERESIPKFIDFVLRNVVNLLVTFP